jgi:restriction system protein
VTLPQFEDIMLPLLKYLSDNEERGYPEVMNHIAGIFKLEKEDREIEKAAGGNLFFNRIGWAKDYLTKAALLEKKRGRFLITSKGLDLLKENPTRIDKKLLMKYEEFLPYISKNQTQVVSTEKEKILSEQTPDDLIDFGITEINDILKNELLEKLKTVDPTFFEKLILHLVESLGYGKGKHVGKSNDKGIDGEISQDKLGLDKIYLQAKRYTGTVSAHEVRDFIGALTLKKSKKGIFITTSNFTSDAYEDVKLSEKNIILIDGLELVKLMSEHNVGVKIKKSFSIKEIDLDYFAEE